MFVTCGESILPWKIILVVYLFVGCSSAGLAADTISGVASNQTLGLPAAGDEVILFRIDQGMHEEGRAKTDAQGSFSFSLYGSDKLHVVRVVHQGVNYDQRISAGEAVNVSVFDAAGKVQGITGSIEIIRIGTNGKFLHVSDMVEVRNDSKPPLTQAGERTFEVYLPAHAKIDSVLAAGSDRIGRMISTKPVVGEPDHYTVNFPLQPGASKFAFNYDLPYSGHTIFYPRSVVPLQQLDVMIPSAMQFASHSSAFQILATGNDKYQVETANQVKAGQGPVFEVSGIGALPALQSQVQSKAPVNIIATAVPSVPDQAQAQTQREVTTSRSMPPVGVFETPSRGRLFILGVGSVLVPGVCAFLLWRKHRRAAYVRKGPRQSIPQAANASSGLVESLKEELFQLEIDRLKENISEEEYVSAQRALEVTITRALARSGSVTNRNFEIAQSLRTPRTGTI